MTTFEQITAQIATRYTDSATATVDATTYDRALIEGLFTQSAEAMLVLDAAESNAVDTRNREITRIMDSMSVRRSVPMAEFLKGNSRSNTARAEIKELFEALTADGILGEISPNTARCYAGAYWICFEAGIPFSPSAANDKSKATIKNAPGKKVDVAKYGKELAKCLVMARLLQRTDDAASLLDMIVEIDPEFVEA